jgi:hypothetical protein
VTGYLRYDHAWQTPGWNVQSPTYLGPSDGYADPGLPDDVSMVRVFGEFLELDTGRALGGVLRLWVDTILTHVTTNKQVMPGAWRPIRFRAGGFSIHLPATDDPQLTPAFVYHARLTVRGVTQEFDFSLPAATPEVNIQSLIQ